MISAAKLAGKRPLSYIGRVLDGYSGFPIDIGQFVEPLGPGSVAFFEFDFVLMNLDDFYTADNVPFVDKLIADYSAGPVITDEDAAYQSDRPCGGAG